MKWSTNSLVCLDVSVLEKRYLPSVRSRQTETERVHSTGESITYVVSFIT